MDNTEIIYNLIHKPPVLRVTLDKTKDIPMHAFNHVLGKNNSEVYIMVRNISHALVEFDQEIITAIDYYCKLVGIDWKVTGEMVSAQDYDKFADAKSTVIRTLISRYEAKKLNYREHFNIALVGNIIKCNNWDEVVIMLSTQFKGLDLYDVLHCIGMGFFYDITIENKSNLPKRYFDIFSAAIIISIMYNTGHVTNIENFKNEN
jgi:hypothetical protein